MNEKGGEVGAAFKARRTACTLFNVINDLLFNLPHNVSLRVGIDLPTIEVRFEHLNIEAKAHVGSRALPTFTNFMANIVENDIAFGASKFRKNYTPVGLGWKT
ncbi:hypothetical protein RIF29_25042 [Crotalaria pallida]|uniref:Uncharacterized protein n=1 Tax=Crotalaria pallida TaxID=3830 RepID=A0AAN9I0Q9_CROPI